MAAIRQANAVWKGGLADGSGSVSAATSGKFMDLDVTWPSRSEEHHGGRTSPEELFGGLSCQLLCDGVVARAWIGRHPA